MMPAAHQMTVTQARAALDSGELSSEALVQACLDRIDEREDDVQAWVNIDREGALAQARGCDNAPGEGVLHGIPVGFKDIVETAGLPTEYGSDIYPGHRPVSDAACVSLVRQAGGIALGKTVTTEFAFIYPNKTRNPHDLSHTPGGSSSGSAAGVADFMMPLAFGTQTGGSVIRPASFCGVVGYKPTIGRFSYAGVKLLSRSLDTLGCMVREVADLALVRNVLLGAPAEIEPIATPPRIGLCRTPWWNQADAGGQQALEATAKALEGAGATVVDYELDSEFEAVGDANSVIMTYEGCRALAWEIETQSDRLSDMLKGKMLPAQNTTYAAYQAAKHAAKRGRHSLRRALNDVDVLLTLSAPGEAPEGFATTGNSVFNRAWTTIGAPCVTLPGHVGPKGLPVGVQLVGARDADETLLAIAKWCEDSGVTGSN